MSSRIDRFSERARILFTSVTLVASNLSVAVVAVIGLHVTTQTIGKVSFGHLVTAISYVTFFTLFADLGVTTVTAREVAREPENAAVLIGSALAFRCTLCLLIAPAIVALAAGIYGLHPMTVFVLIAIFSVDMLANTLFALSNAYFSAMVRSDINGLVLLAGKLVYLGGTVLVAERHMSTAPFVVAYLLGDCAAAGISIVLLYKRIRVQWRFDLKQWALIAKSSFSVGLVEVGARVLSRLDSVLLSVMRPVADVGLYGIGFNFSEVLAQVPSLLMSTALPTLVRTTARPKLRARLQASYDITMFLAVPIAVVGYSLRGPIVSVIAGAGFEGARLPLALLVLMVLVTFPQKAFLWGTIAAGAANQLLPLVVVSFLVNVPLNLLLIPHFGPVGSALAQLVTQVVLVTVTYVVLVRRTGITLRLGTCIRPLASGAASWALLGVVQPAWRHLPGLAACAAGSLIVGLSYLVVSILLRGVPADLVSYSSQMGGVVRRWLSSSSR